MNGVTWGDCELNSSPPCLREPSSISKNRKPTTHYLRPELVTALKEFRPNDAMPSDPMFRGKVPRVPTFKKDLELAGIPFEDEFGRRMDIHALRATFGTMLGAKDASIRSSTAPMRHSDYKLTLKVYADKSHLPLVKVMDTLPAMSVPRQPAQLTALAGVFLGHNEPVAVALSHDGGHSQHPVLDAPSHEKAALHREVGTWRP